MVIDMDEYLFDKYILTITCSYLFKIGMKISNRAEFSMLNKLKEGGKAGQWVSNRNGTHDVGSMQFNTAYLGDLARYGITSNDVAQPGCYPYDLAAWRIRLHIKQDKGDLWTKAANYHSRTPKVNAKYRADLMAKAAKWADWLENRFMTADNQKK